MNKQNQFNNDERSLSITIDYVLGLGIILLLSGMLLTGVFAIQDERREEVVEEEVERVHANSVSEIFALIDTADEIESIGSSQNTVNVTVEINDKLSQEHVTVGANQQSPTTFELITQSDDFSNTETFNITEYNSITSVNVSGFGTSESFEIRYNSNTQELTVTD